MIFSFRVIKTIPQHIPTNIQPISIVICWFINGCRNATDSKVNSIALNTEATELSIKYHPQIKTIFSEKSFRKYSNCNIVQTDNEQKAQSELKDSCHQFHDKICPTLEL